MRIEEVADGFKREDTGSTRCTRRVHLKKKKEQEHITDNRLSTNKSITLLNSQQRKTTSNQKRQRGIQVQTFGKT